LRSSDILNVGSVKLGDRGDEIFFVKSSIRLKNFFKRNQIESEAQIPLLDSNDDHHTFGENEGD
jgi:hypothetical protein